MHALGVTLDTILAHAITPRNKRTWASIYARCHDSATPLRQLGAAAQRHFAHGWTLPPPLPRRLPRKPHAVLQRRMPTPLWHRTARPILEDVDTALAMLDQPDFFTVFSHKPSRNRFVEEALLLMWDPPVDELAFGLLTYYWVSRFTVPDRRTLLQRMVKCLERQVHKVATGVRRRELLSLLPRTIHDTTPERRRMRMCIEELRGVPRNEFHAVFDGNPGFTPQQLRAVLTNPVAAARLQQYIRDAKSQLA